MMGLFTFFFFKAFEYLYVLFAISLPLVVLGVALIISWYLTKNEKTEL